MSFLDKLPEIIEVKLTEKPLFHAVSDLMMDGRFGEQWMVLTEKEVTVWGPDGELVSKLAVADITDVRAVGGIGGGSLLADTKEGPVVLIRYTASLTSIFGFASKLFGAVAKGEERPTASDKEFPRHCPKCRNPLPMVLKLALCVKVTVKSCFECLVMPNPIKYR